MPRFVRHLPDGLAEIEAEDGSRVLVDPSRSAYAASLVPTIQRSARPIFLQSGERPRPQVTVGVPLDLPDPRVMGRPQIRLPDPDVVSRSPEGGGPRHLPEGVDPPPPGFEAFTPRDIARDEALAVEREISRRASPVAPPPVAPGSIVVPGREAIDPGGPDQPTPEDLAALAEGRERPMPALSGAITASAGGLARHPQMQGAVELLGDEEPPAAGGEVYDLTGGGGEVVSGEVAPAARVARRVGPPPVDPILGARGLQPLGLEEYAGTPTTRALDRQIGLTDRSEALALRRAEADSEGIRLQAEAEQEAERTRAETEEARRTAMGESLRRYRGALARVQSMSVDPARFFHDGGNMIGAAIATALGAVGSAVSGNASYLQSASQLVRDAVDRDLEAQRTNLAHAEAGLEGEANLLGQMRSEFSDREAADAAARAAMLAAAARRVEAIGAGLVADETRLQAETLRQQLVQESQAASAEAAAAEEDRAIQNALRLAQTRRELARAARDEVRAARAAAGGGGVRRVTSGQYEAFDAGLRAGVDPEAAAAAAGLPFVPPQAPVGTEQRARVDELDSALRAVEELLPAPEQRAEADVPGFGLVEAQLPDLFVGEEGRRMRQRVANLVDSFMRLRSGANAPEAETQRMVRMITGAGTTEELYEGIAAIRRSVAAVLGRGGRRTSVGAELERAITESGGTVRSEDDGGTGVEDDEDLDDRVGA